MIEVIRPGIRCSIQDLGRYGYGRYGVPISGVMDRASAMMANAIVGNAPDLPVIEIAYGDAHFLMHHTMRFCITGPGGNILLDDKKIEPYRPYDAQKGQMLMISRPLYGVWNYLAFTGGLDTPFLLGSHSQCRGITQDDMLRKGAKLLVKKERHLTFSKTARVKNDFKRYQSRSLEVYPGPEFGMLTANQKKVLFQTSFILSPQCSRMGYKIKGLLPGKFYEITTSGVMPGTVQVPPAGQPIVLMRDSGVTGGYMRVLQLTDNSIDILAQKRPGEKISFTPKQPSSSFDMEKSSGSNE